MMKKNLIAWLVIVVSFAIVINSFRPLGGSTYGYLKLTQENISQFEQEVSSQLRNPAYAENIATEAAHCLAEKGRHDDNVFLARYRVNEKACEIFQGYGDYFHSEASYASCLAQAADKSDDDGHLYYDTFCAPEGYRIRLFWKVD